MFTEKRIIWIDNLKAIGILLVVLAHHKEDIPNWFIRYIYSFHVPLFFFASGLVFRPQKYTGFKALIIDKTKTLLVPYFILSFLSYGFYVAMAPFRSGEPVFSIAQLVKGVASILISSNGIIWMPNGPLWFLTSLFAAEVIFFSLYMVSVTFAMKRGWLVLAMFVFLISILGALDRYFILFRLPWGIDTAMTGAVLLGIGYSLQGIISHESKRLTTKTVMFIIFFAGAGSVFSRINSFVNMTFNMLGNYIYFYISSLSGIAMCVLISKVIPSNRILESIGRNSLLILGLHLPAFVIIRGVQKILLPGTIQMLDGSFQGACIYTVLQLFILTPAIYLINRYFRFVLGR
jgi:fucose 4-O-acetylase-like acetyltransferase